MINNSESQNENIKNGILQSEVFKKIPKKLQDNILEKIQSVVDQFLSNEGVDILFQDDLEYYVYEENLKNNKDLDEGILNKEKIKLRESIFKTSILNTKQIKEKILLESVKIKNGVLKFYSYRYVDIEHLNVCFIVEDEVNDEE